MQAIKWQKRMMPKNSRTIAMADASFTPPPAKMSQKRRNLSSRAAFTTDDSPSDEFGEIVSKGTPDDSKARVV